SRSSRGL
ncbi:unnamed protein product, partial [Callosobruchus maculatus]